jgi:hypothetical protein
MAAVDTTAACAPNPEAYIRDAQGKILYDEQGAPRVDVRLTDGRRPHVGTWAAPGDLSFGTELSPEMVAVSRIPGMNAMSFFHDQWALSWEMSSLMTKASIVPAIVLTYYGTDAPLNNIVTDTVIDNPRPHSPPPLPPVP